MRWAYENYLWHGVEAFFYVFKIIGAIIAFPFFVLGYITRHIRWAYDKRKERERKRALREARP
jgi:hypothetical protein